MSNSLDPDQAQHFVRPDLGSNCLQRLPVGDTSSKGKELTLKAPRKDVSENVVCCK